MKILISAFENFGSNKENPTEKLISRLPDKVSLCGKDEIIIEKILLPVEYINAPEKLLKKADEIKPDIIISLGLAASRKMITPEKIAYNQRYANAPDNAGRTFSGEKIDADGEETLFSTLDNDKIINRLEFENTPCEESRDPGRYVCNDVFYNLMKYSKENGIKKAGFIHFPPFEIIPEEKSLKALMTVIAVSAE